MIDYFCIVSLFSFHFYFHLTDDVNIIWSVLFYKTGSHSPPCSNCFYVIIHVIALHNDDHEGFTDTRQTGRREAGLDCRGHDRQLVASQLRAATVPVHSATHHEAEGAQATLLSTAPRKG